MTKEEKAQGPSDPPEPSAEETPPQEEAAGKEAGAGDAEPSDKPLDTKSKLAAARAGAKSDTKSKLAAARAGGKGGTQSKLAAARAGKGVGASSKLAAARAGGAAKAKQQGSAAGAAKATPKRPAGAPKKPKTAAPAPTRRSFVTWAGVAWVSFTAAIAAMLGGSARFMFPNWLREPPSKFKIGSPDEYPPGTVSTKWKAQFGIWLVHTDYNGVPQIYALRTVCTHLGCTPNWLEGEQKFKCPCHGSGFRISGINFEGPAPRPLERYAIRLADDGQLEVDKSQTFQQEMGQWENAASFVAV